MDENRPQKKFFYVEDGEVYEGVGYQCVPTNPEYWYIPNHGSVLQERLYESRGDARRAAIAWCQQQINLHQNKMNKLLKE